MARLRLFAAAREAAGTGEDTIDASNVGEALKLAEERYGDGFARMLQRCSVLLNGEHVSRDEARATSLGATDEIAVLPPVSGGSFEMIDVGDKDETEREATAACTLRGEATVLERLVTGAVAKGDAVAAAKIAATLAAKRTPDLIPLCHPVRTTFVRVEIDRVPDGIEIRATVRGRDRTGFEMEALTAAGVAALTLYDFAKAEDPRMRVEDLRIVAKSGGKSGSVTYP